MAGKFVINRIRKNRYTFKLKAGNGEIIAVGRQYTAVEDCRDGVECLRRNAGAPVEDQTVRGCVVLPYPKYEIYRDAAGEFRFRLVIGEDQIVATGEGYTAKASCLNGIASIGRNAPDASVAVEE